jgi:hypothetical protein
VQLGEPRPASPLRERLGTAALALLLVPAAAPAAETPADSQAGNQLDVTTLYYGEQGRTQVFEPVVRATRLFGDGQSLFGQIGIDVITGASPTGALPSGVVQTHTSASGRLIRTPAGEIPTLSFQDHRVGLDGGWQRPLGRFVTSTLGVHASREKDYQSLGVSGKLSYQFLDRLFTLDLGGGVNDDSVFPVGGTPPGLSDGTLVSHASNSKRVSDVLVGLSRVVTRRWLLALDASRTFENGYLTEPYKVISLMDPVTGYPVGQLTDQRPESRARSSLLLSSVYHFSQDVLHSSYRYYDDTWGVRSNTIDLKYRHDFEEDGEYFEPHLRLYRQSAADFFVPGLVAGATLPAFATSDYRLGELTTITAGATLSFRFGDFDSGLWTVRAEYIRQAGNSSPPGAIGVERGFDLSPPINTFTAVIGYSFDY